jgi:hypothetical protein
MEELKVAYEIFSDIAELIAILYGLWVLGFDYPKLKQKVEELEKKAGL